MNRQYVDRSKNRLGRTGLLAAVVLFGLIASCGITVAQAPPPVPALKAPANGSTIQDNFPTFVWGASTGAVAYDLQVADNSDFVYPIVDIGWYGGTDYTDSSSIPNGNYYWRVSAWGPGEEWSGWSDPFKFKITGPYEVPSEFPDIREAIRAIPYSDSGEVLVAPGTYMGYGNCNLSDFGSRSVQLRSSGGPSSTIIDCGDSLRGYYFNWYTMPGTSVEGFTIRNAIGYQGTGGAIDCEGAPVTINNCVIESCPDGGIFVRYWGQATITNCIIKNNQQRGISTSGGGRANITGCTFQDNTGYALYLNADSNTVVTNCDFISNQGYEGDGYGAYIYNSAPTFQSCNFLQNEGHGLYTWNSNLSMDNCTFTGNNHYRIGGGVYARYGSVITLTNSTFDGNSARYGAGIFLADATANLAQCLFDGNTAQNKGGGVFVEWNATLTATGCTFVNNSADTGSAIYIETEPGVPGADGNSITGRPAEPSSQSLGGAMVSECLFAYNQQDAPIYMGSYAWIEIMCSNIYGNTGGNWVGQIEDYLDQDGNISADPLFCDVGGDSYGVTANSPCVTQTGCGTIGAYGIGCGAIELSLTPASFEFTAASDDPNPAAQNLQINNLGGNLLHWELSENSSWINVNPSGGTAPSTVSISVDKTGLPGGVYNETLVVYGDNCINSPQAVPVSFTITSGEIAVDPTLLYFDYVYGDPSAPSQQMLSITNIGSGSLSCVLSHGQSWLTLSPAQFTAPMDVSVSVDPTDLTPGTYLDTIVISSDDALNSPQYVGVTFTIDNVDAPTLEVTASTHPVTGDYTLLVYVNAGDNLGITFQGSTPLPGVTPVLGVSDAPFGSVFQPMGDGTAQFDWSPVPALSGAHYMTVIVDDDWQSSTTVVGIVVNQEPSFTSTCDDVTLLEGQPFECVLVAQDPEGSAVTVIWDSVPSGAMFVDNGDGSADFLFRPDYSDVDATYAAVFTASDQLSSVADTLYIDVDNRQLIVQSMEPSPGQDNDILISDSIQIQFNEPIDEASLATNLVFSSAKGAILSYEYVPQQHYLLIGAATGHLIPLDTIGVTLNAAILDLAGYPLDQSYLETFVTGAAVYPGDANNNGIVDERDILPLGLYWGNTGPARGSVPDLSWAMAPAHVAFQGERWEPLGGVFADADGSGLVEANDICGITENWTMTHTIAEGGKNDDGISLVTSLDGVDESVLQALYQAVLTCPESQGRNSLRETLEALLDHSPSASSTLPTTVELYQNYPNPFNPFTTIRFYLPSGGRATLSIYNMLGQRVATLIDGHVNAGYMEAIWDATDVTGHAVASGIYFYRLETTDFSETRRMMLLK